jgi:SNF2 family DNA or RNA helicase
VLNFQMSGMTVTSIKGSNVYIFLYETNEQYHGKALIRSSASKIRSIKRELPATSKRNKFDNARKKSIERQN